MTVILETSPDGVINVLAITLLEAAAAGRPGWLAPKPTLAMRTVVVSGEPYTGEHWIAIEAGVSIQDGQPTAIVLTRRATRGGWANQRVQVLARELRKMGARRALAYADELLAEAVRTDSGGLS